MNNKHRGNDYLLSSLNGWVTRHCASEYEMNIKFDINSSMKSEKSSQILWRVYGQFRSLNGIGLHVVYRQSLLCQGRIVVSAIIFELNKQENYTIESILSQRQIKRFNFPISNDLCVCVSLCVRISDRNGILINFLIINDPKTMSTVIYSSNFRSILFLFLLSDDDRIKLALRFCVYSYSVTQLNMDKNTERRHRHDEHLVILHANLYLNVFQLTFVYSSRLQISVRIHGNIAAENRGSTEAEPRHCIEINFVFISNFEISFFFDTKKSK